jgi:hypothetical protein
MYVDIGASTASGAMAEPLPFNLLLDEGRRKGVEKLKDFSSVTALVSAESKLAVDCGPSPICRSAIIANGHLFSRPYRRSEIYAGLAL